MSFVVPKNNLVGDKLFLLLKSAPIQTNEDEHPFIPEHNPRCELHYVKLMLCRLDITCVAFRFLQKKTGNECILIASLKRNPMKNLFGPSSISQLKKNS